MKDFTLVVLTLLMFNVCGIVSILKLEFLNFCGTERVKKNNDNKKIKNHSKPHSLEIKLLFNQFQKFGIFLWFSTETLTVLLLVPRWAAFNTDLLLDSNIVKMVKVNIAFMKRF